MSARQTAVTPTVKEKCVCFNQKFGLFQLDASGALGLWEM